MAKREKAKKLPKVETPAPPSEEDRVRIAKAVLDESEDDIDLMQTVDPEKTSEEDDGDVKPLGPWRAKLMVPLLKTYATGLRKMVRSRKLLTPQDVDTYEAGIGDVFDSCLGVCDILLRKYIDILPYAEEGAALMMGATVVVGDRYYSHRLKKIEALKGKPVVDVTPAEPAKQG